MTHWALPYMGRPWVNGAQGPDAFDCWSFFRWVQRLHFGRETPFIDVDADNPLAVRRAFEKHPERQRWTLVPAPSEGDAVLMAHNKYPSHVGVWLDVDGGGVLHCINGEGVVFSSRSALQISGWGRVEFYRYASDV